MHVGRVMQQRHVHIELETRDWATQRESLISSTIVGDGADVVRVHHKYAVEFGALGGLLALDDFPDFPKVRAKLLDNIWDHVAYRADTSAFPSPCCPLSCR